MLINFSYAELMQLASCLSTVENVFGTGTTCMLQDKIADCMEFMDNAPVTDVYPGIHRVK